MMHTSTRFLQARILDLCRDDKETSCQAQYNLGNRIVMKKKMIEKKQSECKRQIQNRAFIFMLRKAFQHHIASE